MIHGNYSGSKFQGSKFHGSRFHGSRFKPALVRRNVWFNTVLLGTTTKDSMKGTDKPGLGQGLESDEEY